MLKYIVINGSEMIIFPPTLQHKDVAGSMCVTSAGFIEGGKCYGQSDSLNISSNAFILSRLWKTPFFV